MTDKAIDTSPGHNDVLFGIGIGFQNHVGNTHFRNLISGCLKKYDKSRMAEAIIKIIHEAGGKFLRNDKEMVWIPVTDRTTLVRKFHIPLEISPGWWLKDQPYSTLLALLE
jgi:hypothetical protein